MDPQPPPNSPTPNVSPAAARPETGPRPERAFVKSMKVKKLGTGFSFVHKGLLYKVPARAVLEAVLFEAFRLETANKAWPAPLGKLVTMSHATEPATPEFVAALDAALK